jgi:hypothetical protein
MRYLFLTLPAVFCFAHEADLPSQLARLQQLPTEQVRSLQAKLAMDSVAADKKAYYDLYLDYVLASRQRNEDPKGAKALVERDLATHENSRDPETQALVGALLGLKIGFSPMSGMTLSPRAMQLFGEAQAQRPSSPRIALLKAIHVLHMPAFVGGGAKAALPLMENAVRLATSEAPTADPWAPTWGRIESLGWLAYAQIENDQLAEARQTADQVLALSPGNGFITAMVLPRLQTKGK